VRYSAGGINTAGQAAVGLARVEGMGRGTFRCFVMVILRLLSVLRYPSPSYGRKLFSSFYNRLNVHGYLQVFKATCTHLAMQVKRRVHKPHTRGASLGRAHDEARRRRPGVPVGPDHDVGLDRHITDGVRLPSPRRRVGLRGRGAPPQALRGGGSDRTAFSIPRPACVAPLKY
jgi:hypothetical protein